jgi:hypothetical protein
MKKYLLGIIAIVMAVGFSAFTKPEVKRTSNKEQTSYYWFRVANGYGDLSSLTSSQVSAYLGFSSTAPTSGCSGSGYNCIVGFNADDVDIPNEMLKQGSHGIDNPGTQRSTK